MKYAWYPGCVSQGACPELFKATLAVADKLGIELVELKEAACTGAGILSERNPELSDTLNARTFAMAEKLGLPIMTICSTCQGVMSQANYKLQNDPDYLAKVNETLALEGLEYKGTTEVSHLLWVIVEDVGLDKVAAPGHPAPHRRQDSTLLRLLHPPPHYVSRLRRPPRARHLHRADNQHPRRHRRRLLRQDPLLRLPHPHHERKGLLCHDRQPPHRGQRRKAPTSWSPLAPSAT